MACICFGSQRRMFQQALAQMGEISVRIAGRSYTLVHLHDLHRWPGHVFAGQVTQHLPRSASAADRHYESAAVRDGRAGVGGDYCSRLFGDRIGIGEHVDLHACPFTGSAATAGATDTGADAASVSDIVGDRNVGNWTMSLENTRSSSQSIATRTFFWKPGSLLK